ncbi:MAG: cobalt-precorrin-7 (C(5))-methyltransferase [Methanoculleaceae archaeon]
MIIVGVGAAPGLITAEAASEIRRAKVVYGSRRAIELAGDCIPPDCRLIEITDYRRLDGIPDDAVVLSTGDPMCAGLGFLEGRVIPGISSVQIAAARLRVRWTDLSVITGHGGEHVEAIRLAGSACRCGKVACILADPSFSIERLAGELIDIEGCRIAVCERLGYENERIAVGTPEDPPSPEDRLFLVMAGCFMGTEPA